MPEYAVAGCLEAKIPWDCSNVDVVDSFVIDATTPPNTAVGVAFLIGGEYYRLAGGSLEKIPTQSTGEHLLTEGNTLEELTAIKGIPDFVNKSVFPVIAMGALGGTTEYPKLKLGLKCYATAPRYTYTEESQDYVLGKGDIPLPIVDVGANAHTEGEASITVEAKINTGETWTEYMPLDDIKGKDATAVKIRATYRVENVGAGTAHLNNVFFAYKGNFAHVNGEKADIITKTMDLKMDVAFVRTTIPHERLVDADIKAYIALRDEPMERDRLMIGTGTGVRQVINLKDTGIDAKTLKVFIETTEAEGFDYNLLKNQIIITAPAGTGIYASYEYGLGLEEWREMDRGTTEEYQRDSELYSTEFYYAVPTGEERRRAAIKYELIRLFDTATEELGTATGYHQIFKLKHKPEAESILIPGAIFYLDEEGYLHLSAPAGTELIATYSYKGDAPIIKEYVIAWNR